MQRRKGKGRKGKEGKARQGKAGKARKKVNKGKAMRGKGSCGAILMHVLLEPFFICRDRLAFVNTMPMCKNSMWNYSDETSNMQAVCVIAVITGYMASVVKRRLLWRCKVVQPSWGFLATWLSVVALCGHFRPP